MKISKLQLVDILKEDIIKAVILLEQTSASKPAKPFDPKALRQTMGGEGHAAKVHKAGQPRVSSKPAPVVRTLKGSTHGEEGTDITEFTFDNPAEEKKWLDFQKFGEGEEGAQIERFSWAGDVGSEVTDKQSLQGKKTGQEISDVSFHRGRYVFDPSKVANLAQRNVYIKQLEDKGYVRDKKTNKFFSPSVTSKSRQSTLPARETSAQPKKTGAMPRLAAEQQLIAIIKEQLLKFFETNNE